MVAAQQLQPNPLSTAEDLRKQVIRLMQANGEDTRGNILVLPQVFLEFLDYDHKMALFLNHLLYWQSRTKHPQRWVYKSYHDLFNELGFKESVIRRLLHGDPKTRQHQRTLTEIGVEVKVKRAPNGSPTNHFRINLDVFLGAIRSFWTKNRVTSSLPILWIPQQPIHGIRRLEGRESTSWISPESARNFRSRDYCTDSFRYDINRIIRPR